jgi:hypothetical protein
MKKLILIALSLISLSAGAQNLKKFYRVELDTIQHINWNADLTLSQALSSGSVKYPYYWADHIVWEYDLSNMTATWIGGSTRKVYKIRRVSNLNGVLRFEVGNEAETGWIDSIKATSSGLFLLTSENVDLVNGQKDGSFTRNAKMTSH